MDTRYIDGYFPTPYGDQSGPGWGIADGTVSGERLRGTVNLSNHSSTRSDGVVMPEMRGVITTADGRKLVVSFTGRTVFVDRENGKAGRALFMVLFESEDKGYSWLNNEVCFAEGLIPPGHLEIYLCTNELLPTT